MKHFVFMLLLLTTALAGWSQRPQFPLRVSPNHRYFTDAAGKPFLYHADTGWQIFTKLTTQEAIEYLRFRKAQGFNTIQVQIGMAPEQANRYGQRAFDGNVDFGRPNEAYHNHIASIIAIADTMGLLVVMSQPWLGCCQEAFGNTPEKPIQRNGPAKNRSYGNYLGRKFAKFDNLMWIGGGDNDPKGDRESLVALIEGLHETAPKHQLITYHASPPHSSTDLFQYAPWLGFSFIYTYWREKPNDWVVSDLQPHVYEAALREWSKSDVMPFVLGESQYEGNGRIGNDMGIPQMVRRQAYWTLLCGGAGHAYGSDLWNFPVNWRDIMRYPGAYQMAHVRNFFEKIPWWTLSPDAKHQAVVAYYGDWSKANFVTTALSTDKRIMVSYLPQTQAIRVDFGYLSGNKFNVRWYNPTTGEFSATTVITQKTVQRLGPATGEDWVLLVEAVE